MPEEQRVIFHCDCNSFYASVELWRYPGAARRARTGHAAARTIRHGTILAKRDSGDGRRPTAETV